MLRHKIASAYTKSFLTVIVLPILIILILLNNMYSNALINITANSQLQMLNEISISVDNEIRQNILTSLNIGINPEILTLANRWFNEPSAPMRYALDMELRAKMSQPVLLISDYERITFYFRNSDDVISFGSVPIIPYEYARQTSWYQEAMRNPGRLIVDASIRQVNGRYALTFAINPSIIVHNNEIEVIYFSFFANFIRDHHLDSGNLLIADRHGRIIFCARNERLGYNISDFSETAYITAQPVGRANRSSTLVSVMPIHSTHWQIIRTVPNAEIIGQVSNVTRYGYIAISLYVLVFVLFTMLFYQKIIKQFLKLEMQTMQYQITPHFIINTLNSIKIMAMISGQENIEKTTHSFMRLLQAVLGKTGMQGNVKEEIENIKHYIHIMKVRFEDKFDVEYDIAEDIKDLIILRFLLQPIVENCIIHGLNDKEIGGLIRIKGYRSKNRLIIEVEDNGVGMTEAHAQILLEQNRRNEKGFLSMGVFNVNRRIKLNFGQSFGLTIQSILGEYTKVICELPIQVKGKDVN